jgi:hypothetical protein
VGKNRKSRFKGLLHFTQANGRERKPEGMGEGPWQETGTMGHATKTKTKEEMRRRALRREKMNRYEED